MTLAALNDFDDLCFGTVSRAVGMCAGFGQKHTNNPEADFRKPYSTVTLDNIKAMMSKPPSVAKESAQWAIFTDYSGELARNADHLRSSGALYYALWGDIDEAAGVTAEAILKRTAANVSQAETLVYASRSATKENQKSRIIVPLAEPVDAATFEIMQEVLNNRLEAEGLKPDRVTETCQQLCYLPNKGAFYYSGIDGSGALDPKSWANEVEAIRAARHAEEAAAKVRMVASAARYAELMEKQGFLPRDAANAAYGSDGRDLWIANGAKVKGNRLLSPLSSSGVAGITFKDGKWFSVHGSDIDAGIGQHSSNGRSCFGDAFDVLCFFEYGNDATRAARELAQQLDGQGNKDRQREYMQQKAADQAAAMFEEISNSKPEQAEKIDVLAPPGIAGDICYLMSLRARRDRPELYPLAALHLLALVSSARRSVYTSKLNLITLGIASTGAGKENPQDVVKRLANDCYLSGHIHSDVGSFKEMILNLIDGDGKNLYIMDEVHSMLDSMKSKNAATYESKTEAEILKMTTTALYTFRGAEKRALIADALKKVEAITKKLDELPEGTGLTDEVIKLTKAKEKYERQAHYIENGWPDPFVSIMGHSVPERLDKFASNPENIASGFIGRSLLVRCAEGAEPLKLDLHEADANSLHASIVYRIMKFKNTARIITATDEADLFMRERSAYFEQEEQRNNEYMGAIYRRATEHLFKVASLLAVESGQINISHAKYAHALVTASIGDVRYLLQQAMAAAAGASEQVVMAAARLKVLKAAKPFTGISYSVLNRAATRSNEWKELQDKDIKRDLFSELIDNMTQRGELEFFGEGKKKRYRSTAAL